MPVQAGNVHEMAKTEDPMTGDKPKQRFDRTLIRFGEDFEVRYWCNSLGCTLPALRAAVRAVGNSAEAVRAHLKK